MFMPMPIPMGGGGGPAAEEAGGVGTVGGAASEGPLPSTEYEEDEFAARARGDQAPQSAGDSTSPADPRGGDPDGLGGWNGGGGAGGGPGGEDLMQDPWASEAPEEGGTWSWGDLFDQDDGGGGGGGGDGEGW